MLLVILLFTIFTTSFGKIFQSSFILSSLRRNDGWLYVGRMNLNPGTVTIVFKASMKLAQTLDQNIQIQLAAIPTSIWKDQSENKCHIQKYSEATLALKKKEEVIIKSFLSKSGGYYSVSSTLVDLKQKTLYNFVIRDCSRTLGYDQSNRRTRLQYELEVRNNQQHLSVYEDCYSWALPLLMLLQGITILMLKRDVEEDGQNWSKYLLKISLYITIGSLASKYIGHLLYASFGKNYGFFEIVYLLVHSVADSIVMFLLVLLAFGWTVTFINSRDFDIYIPLGCMCGFIYMILTVLNKITDGHDKYHMFDTIPAYIMILFRMIIFTIFIFGAIRSFTKVPQKQQKMRKFFIHISVLGTIYMVIVPVAFMAIQLVDQEHREHVMMLGLQLGRIILYGWLGILSGWKGSSYRKVINSSFMQKEEKYY